MINLNHTPPNNNNLEQPLSTIVWGKPDTRIDYVSITVSDL